MSNPPSHNILENPMQYAIRRILINIPIVLAATVVIFILVNLAPGDPVDFYVNEEMGITRESLGHLEEKFGLNDPIYIRYVKWLGATMQGDLGFRFKNGDDVAEVLVMRLQRTLLLMATALLIGIVVGISLGVFTGCSTSIWWPTPIPRSAGCLSTAVCLSRSSACATMKPIAPCAPPAPNRSGSPSTRRPWSNGVTTSTTSSP